MDLYVRIPATNMHDVGIQTIPSDSKLVSSPREEEHVGSHDDQSFDSEQGETTKTSKDASLANQTQSQIDPVTLTFAMGETQWCMESSTPRKVNADPQPQSSREKGWGLHDNFGDLDDGNSARALSTFQSRIDQIDLGVDYKLHLITSELGVSDWMKEREHVPLDVGRIKFVSPDLRSVDRDSRSESCPSVVSNASGRSLNEPLDKYMVIRQRTFHGLPRSRKELRVLPLTDPRESNPAVSNPSWLYRSKTDLFIEKRRNKIAAARKASHRNTRHSWHDLDGITFAGLMETLPSVNQPFSEETCEVPSDVNDNQTETVRVGSNNSGSRNVEQEDSKTQSKMVHSNSRLPPISLKQNHQQFKIEDNVNGSTMSPRNNSGTSSASSSESDSSVQTERQKHDTSKQQSVRGKLRKQSLAAIPLRLWEPSFDCVVVSSRKVLQPRQLVKPWSVDAPTRQQPSPLK